MKAVIVDDEPKAIELLESYASKFEDIEIVAAFRNSVKAVKYLNENKVDLVFLDINMPNLSGISVSKLLNESSKIVFTTAHSEFAVESYEIGASDYLLKPISFERFALTIKKIMTYSAANDNSPFQASPEQIEYLLLKSGTKLFRVDTKDILFLEKNGNYMNYYYGDKKLLVRQTIQSALSSLPKTFLQVHKSYIVPIQKIELIEKNMITIKGKRVPISPQYKSEVLRAMDRNQKSN